MKKFLFVLMGVFAVAGAFAAGENVPTSKSYVDAAVAQKQDKISANIIMPTGYTALEYIESTGTQYIDTLVTLGVDFEIYLDAMVSGRADNILFAGGLNVYRYNASVFASGINGNWGDGGIQFGGDNNRFYIGISPFWVMHYNGVKYVVVRRYSPSGTLRVFSGTVGRLYNLKIYSGPLLQFNGIPARRNSDNVVGMYDTISGQFFTNSGTGEFIAGPVIIPDTQVLTNTGVAGEYGTKGIYDANGEYATQTQNLVDAATMNAGVQNAIDSEFQCIEWLDPNDHSSDCLLLQLGGITQVPAGYTQLEYIESTGTQWIDTGIIPTNYDWYADFTMSTSAFGKYFFGAGGSVSWGCNAPGYYFGIANTAGSSQWGQGCADSVASNNLGVLPNIFYNYKISKYGIYVNGLLKSEMRNSINLSGTSSLYIARTNSSSVSQYNNGLSKWRTVKIYNDIDHIVFHGIPARRDSDGEIGMYDTVTNTFFTNAGTGEFIAGPIVYLPNGE